MRRFWYFDVSVWSGEKKLCLLGLWQNSVLAPYCKDWEPSYPLNTSKGLQLPWIPLRHLQTPPRHPQTHPDIPQTHSRHLQGTQHANRRQQTLPETPKHWQVLFEYVWQCRLASVVVCLHVLFPGYVWEVSVGCLGGVWGYLSVNHGNRTFR